jgi:hypothetical protein
LTKILIIIETAVKKPFSGGFFFLLPTKAAIAQTGGSKLWS